MQFIFYTAELVGTIAFAISGAVLAIQKKLDLFGILLLGVITALGGGTVRDLILGHTPPRMFYNVEYVALAVAAAFIVFLVAKYTKKNQLFSSGVMDFLFVFCDSLGLGIFAVIGTQAGITEGFGDNAFLCIFLGMMTGVGGGIIRDMMCTDIPFVLRKHIYAVAAILGSVIFYVLLNIGMAEAVASLAGMLVTLVLRLLAWHYRWNLPKAHSD